MKNATAYTLAQRYAAAQSVVWLLKIDDGTSPWLAASRPITFEGQAYPARLAAPPRWSMRSARDFGVGGVVTTAAEVVVNDIAGVSGGLGERLGAAAPFQFEAELKLLWIDDPPTWIDADAVTLLSGLVTGWRQEPGRVGLELKDRVSAQSRKSVGRVLVPSMIPGETSSLAGQFLPIIFGRHDAVRLLELRAGVTTKLTSALDVHDDVIDVISVEGFPRSGTVQVGGELIQYSDVDAVANTLGTSELPITRGQEVKRHFEGDPARWAPPGGFQWLVADHPCASVDDVQADGEALAPADWTAGERTLGAIDAQIVTMERWPVRSRFSATARTQSAKSILSPAVYSVAPGSNALNPELAIDTKLTSTAAHLTEVSHKLAFAISGDLGTEGTLLGQWSGAAIRVRYSATQCWDAGSKLKVVFKQGAGESEVEIPHPDPSECVAGSPLGIHEFEFDLASAIAVQTGWAAFDVSPPVEMQVKFVASSDSTEILIHDLDLRIDYFAQLLSQEARRVTARVEGWELSPGQAAENPADVIEALLTDSRFGALAAGEVNTTSLSAIGSDLAALGYTFARRIADGRALLDLLDSAARESATWIRLGGEKVEFSPVSLAPEVGGSVETLDSSKALDPGARTWILDPTESRKSDCLTLVSAPLGGEQPQRVWSRCADGSPGNGSIPLKVKLDWLDGREEGALTHLGERLRWSMREPFKQYDQDYPLGAGLLEPGDSVASDLSALSLDQTPHWVESVLLKSATRIEVRSRGFETGPFCWQLDSQTFLRSFGFGSRMVLYLSGSPIAIVEQAGRLLLGGFLKEDVSFSAGPFATPIAENNGSIYWGTGSGAVYTPFARIDSSGNLHLKGTLREQSNLAFMIDGQCLGADALRFWLSPQGNAGVLEFISGVLHLAGTLTEEGLI